MPLRSSRHTTGCVIYEVIKRSGAGDPPIKLRLSKRAGRTCPAMGRDAAYFFWILFDGGKPPIPQAIYCIILVP